MDVFIEAERLLADCISNDTEEKYTKQKKEIDNGEAQIRYSLLKVIQVVATAGRTNKKRSHHDFILYFHWSKKMQLLSFFTSMSLRQMLLYAACVVRLSVCA